MKTESLSVKENSFSMTLRPHDVINFQNRQRAEATQPSGKMLFTLATPPTCFEAHGKVLFINKFGKIHEGFCLGWEIPCGRVVIVCLCFISMLPATSAHYRIIFMELICSFKMTNFRLHVALIYDRNVFMAAGSHKNDNYWRTAESATDSIVSSTNKWNSRIAFKVPNVWSYMKRWQIHQVLFAFPRVIFAVCKWLCHA